jgi:hypothetical protein
MSKASLFILFLVVAALTGGVVFLSAWDIPAPTSRVEKIIPHDRFTN